MQPEPSILNKTVDRLVCRSGGISRVDGLKAGCTVTALAPHLVASNFQGLVPAYIHESKRRAAVFTRASWIEGAWKDGGPTGGLTDPFPKVLSKAIDTPLAALPERNL